MPRGGRRPGAGAKKGSHRADRSAEEIAERRSLVRTLFYMGQRPGDILAAIEKEAPSLVDGLARPYGAIVQDIAAVQKEDAEDLQSNRGLPALAAYIETQSSIMRWARSAGEQPQGPPRVRALQVESECADKIALAYGVPTGRPAIPFDLGQRTPWEFCQEWLARQTERG